jgi:hypothetical protein
MRRDASEPSPDMLSVPKKWISSQQLSPHSSLIKEQTSEDFTDECKIPPHPLYPQPPGQPVYVYLDLVYVYIATSTLKAFGICRLSGLQPAQYLRT